jgi:CheY-like chemotaxis protein/predicted negative regulator of RcsB-dependent stress response
MQKDDLIVLIVDDDVKLGKALSELISRLGYKPIHVTKPDEALAVLKLQAVHAALIDCMLPKMNGRDLAIKIRAESSAEMPLIMMSGVYRDKSYIKEVIQTTKAAAFLTKPFDLQVLAETLDNQLKAHHQVEASLVPIHSLMGLSQPTPKERMNAINESDIVHGFDLPWVYSLLLDDKISGHLNLISADGEVMGVGFNRGRIVQVNLADSQSYFGRLLVDHGFISAAQLELTLKNGQKSTRRLGELLVDQCLISPHAVEAVITQQQGIRLSKTIADTSLKINFIRSSDIRDEASITRTQFTEMVEDWMQSKIKIEWLKASYMPWLNYNIRRGPEFSESHSVFGLKSIQRFSNLVPKLISGAGMTLEQLISQNEGDETALYRFFYLLLVSRVVTFGELTHSISFEPQKRRIAKFDAELEKQNFFERLGVSNKSKENEIKRAYLELAKVLHPDKLPQGTPDDLRALTHRAFEKINQAYQTLSDAKLRGSYIRELEQGSAEKILAAESLMEQAKQFLSRGDVKKAHDHLQEATELIPRSPELRMLLMWAKLKTPNSASSKETIDYAREELGAIPPEDRHNAIYYFVKGLFLFHTGEIEAAIKNIENAIAGDPDFIEARRELNVMKRAGNEKPKDILHVDLKDVVGALFKKKK